MTSAEVHAQARIAALQLQWWAQPDWPHSVYWGMWLAPALVEAAGGLARLVEAPVARVQAFDSGAVFLQLTEALADVREPEFADDRKALERFLAPILLSQPN